MRWKKNSKKVDDFVLEGVDPTVWRSISFDEAANMALPSEMLVFGVGTSGVPTYIFVRVTPDDE